MSGDPRYWAGSTSCCHFSITTWRNKTRLEVAIYYHPGRYLRRGVAYTGIDADEAGWAIGKLTEGMKPMWRLTSSGGEEVLCATTLTALRETILLTLESDDLRGTLLPRSKREATR